MNHIEVMGHVVAGIIAGSIVTLVIKAADVPDRVSRLLDRVEAVIRHEVVYEPPEMDAERWWWRRAEGSR